MNDFGQDRMAKWLVGDRLSCVLHIGDGALAYQLSEQGHEVVVVGDDAIRSRNPEIMYVRTMGDRLPFVSDSFDVVLAPELREAPLALAEFARVLRPDGLLSTVTRTHDHSIPWMRKLRDIVRADEVEVAHADTFTASGLFDEPEQSSHGSWEKLDLPGLMRFAHEIKHPTVGEDELVAVHELFANYAGQTGFLRLRHETTCSRARVDKSSMTEPTEPPDTLLLDFR